MFPQRGFIQALGFFDCTGRRAPVLILYFYEVYLGGYEFLVVFYIV
jgi:hypothetical protein